eukprot:g1104.t1
MKVLPCIITIILLINGFLTIKINSKKIRLGRHRRAPTEYVDPDTFANMLGKPKELTHTCVEKLAFATCDLFCMCEMMVNRQVGLWSRLLPENDATEVESDSTDKYIGDSVPKSQCDIWRKNKDIEDEECYAMCTIAEQYVIASHGWDSKVCARAENEGKAYVVQKKHEATKTRL